MGGPASALGRSVANLEALDQPANHAILGKGEKGIRSFEIPSVTGEVGIKGR